MLTAAQADKLLKKNSNNNPPTTGTEDLSPAYAALSKVVRRNQHHLKRAPTDYYLEHFKATDNPWRNEEGILLAKRLFGEHKAPYVADIWDDQHQFPYQSGYSRRAFRSTHPDVVLGRRIEVLNNLYLLNVTGYYQLDLAETMRYAVYHYQQGHSFAPLYAVALNRESKNGPLTTLAWDILQGEDEIGGVHTGLIVGLLKTERPDCWEMVEKLALAAQREEGLRQTIFESADQAHIGAFTRFLRLIADNDLARFSAVVRAVDTWFGFGWEAPKKKTIDRALELAIACLESPEQRDTCLNGQDHLAVYCALWSVGLQDVHTATHVAMSLVEQKARPLQLTALFFMTQTGYTDDRMGAWITANFGQDLLLDYYITRNYPSDRPIDDLFAEQLVAHAKALPKSGKTLATGIFDWLNVSITPTYFYDFMIRRADGPRLLQMAEDLAALPLESRELLIRTILPDFYQYSLSYGSDRKVGIIDTKQTPWVRPLLHQALNDRSGAVLATGVKVLRHLDTIIEEDAELVTDLLRRKGKELRGELIEFVSTRPDDQVPLFTDRLLPAGNVNQRLAGLEVLSVLQEADRLPNYVEARVADYRTRASFSKNEEVLLEKFVPTTEAGGFSLANGFGVVDYGNVRPLPTPQLKFEAPAKSGFLNRLTGAKERFLFSSFVDAEKIRTALEDLYHLVDDNGDHEFTIEYNNNYTQTHLLRNTIKRRNPYEEMDARAQVQDLPLGAKFEGWYRQSGLNDFELFYLALYLKGKRARTENANWFTELSQTYYPQIGEVDTLVGERGAADNRNSDLAGVAELIYAAYADHSVMDPFQVDLLEDLLARWPIAERKKQESTDRWGYTTRRLWTDRAMHLLPSLSKLDDPHRFVTLDAPTRLRYYDLQLLLYASGYSEGYPPKPLHEVAAIATAEKYYYGGVRQPADLAVHLYREGKLNQDDLLLHALHRPNLLASLFNAEAENAKLTDPIHHFPVGLADELVTNLLSIELDRGDLPTEATPYTERLPGVIGVDYLVTLTERLGKETLHRGYSYGKTSKKDSFSKLIKKCVPAETDTLPAFTAKAQASEVTVKRWLEVAMYAPQWAPWIGEMLKINELESAVWWFHAHASEYAGDRKKSIVARYTPIELTALGEGAIDVDWFAEVYSAVGKKNWKQLHDAAKYISDGNGHRQVKLYSGIMLGETKITETLKRIQEKRDKAYVKGLGLVPLSKRTPRKDLLRRYELLQQFLHESKQFGNQRRESEKLAVEIALENLARTAGYDDPVRFSWVMEGQSTQAIMDRALVQLDEVTLELVIDEQGKADITVEKAGKSQKSIPAKLRKHKEVLRLKEDKAALRKQQKRTLASLERAMVEGQTFTLGELTEIHEHPIVRALLANLVLVQPNEGVTGFYTPGGLFGIEGTRQPIGSEQAIRIAHPTDLYATVSWDLWQRYAFDNQLVQPFKQIFRELYLPTANEREEKYQSSRYQGNQIQTKKTVALLTSRGWTVDYDSGLQKIDYKRGVIASLYAMADWFSPADIEAPTLEEVAFHSRKTYKPVALDAVDPILFSETMRDVDLVVSVAHAGGVDPEASHSSMEMRAALARESARLFRLTNVEVKERFIIIKGKHGSYSLHLGSGMVSKDGLQLSIIPVHSQHRGKLFLPFVDEDPKSAEIISKMRLLAEDDRIKDPTVLAQLMR